MPLIEWTDDMKVGIAAVDHEHAILVGEINTIGDIITTGKNPESIVGLLGLIHAHIESHFALEERIMRQIAYNGYEAHKEDHDRLLEDIRDIMDEATIGPGAIHDKLGERLSSWFGDHFRTLDRSFHTFSEKMVP